MRFAILWMALSFLPAPAADIRQVLPVTFCSAQSDPTLCKGATHRAFGVLETDIILESEAAGLYSYHYRLYPAIKSADLAGGITSYQINLAAGSCAFFSVNPRSMPNFGHAPHTQQPTDFGCVESPGTPDGAVWANYGSLGLSKASTTLRVDVLCPPGRFDFLASGIDTDGTFFSTIAQVWAPDCR